MSVNLPHRHREPQVGRGAAFGTFGELLQGVLPEGDLNFLVTFPVRRYTRAVFAPDASKAGVAVFPPHKVKARTLADALLKDLGLPAGGLLLIDSDIPEGKGMASSSADLVATARAICDSYGLAVPTRRLEQCMQRVEPSDGVMYSGVVAFYHRKVELRQHLGSLPQITVVAADEGGAVDTVQFNQIPKPFTFADKVEYAELLVQIGHAVRDHDLAGIGRVATRSGELNQKLHPKRTLADMIALSDHIGGLGVAVAHSGTCLGVLLSPTDPRYARQLPAACEGVYGLVGNVAVHESHDFTKTGW
ncbi:MAG TPA: hypothetical protein VNT75_29190 [Symbiobacteriaceae bacterium]|nr:hypothetical protein [Symbiobacteriaceae bacterium]